MLARSRFAALALAIVATCVSLRPAAAGEAPAKGRYRGPTGKFSILMFEEGKPAPRPPARPEADEGDKPLVVRFYEPGDDDKEYSLPEGNRGIAEVYALARGQAGSIEDLLGKAAKKRGMELAGGKGKPIKTKDGVAGTAWLEPLAG